MDPQHALTADADTITAYTRTLSDEQVVDFLAAIDAAELLYAQREISLADSALFYAERIGWPVFPLKPRGKAPLTRNGFKDATRDRDTVISWWMRWPEANIGTPTGADGCGYDVIDIDGRLGIASLADLKHADCPDDCSADTFCAATGELPPVVCRAMTPGDSDGPGFHYFIEPTGDGNGTNIAPGIDYRGAGGYIVAPPSIGANGARYAWVTRPAARVAEAAA